MTPDASRDWSRAALDTLSDAAHVVDAQWRWRYLNAAARSVARGFGYDPDALIGQVVWEAVPWVAGGEWERRARHSAETGTPTALDVSFPGSTRQIEARLIPIVDGGLLCLTRDVTERNRAATAREENVSRLGSALRLAGLGTWSIDLRTRLGAHDEATAAMLGLPAQSDAPAIAQWIDVVHPDDLAQARAAFETTIAAARRPKSERPATDDALRYECELRAVRSGGETRHLVLSARVLCDAERVPERVVGVVRDVTDERVAEREREALLASERRVRAGLERVHAVTASLAAARTHDEVIAVALRAQRQAGHASLATIWLFDEHGLARVGVDDDPSDFVPLVSAAARVPLDGSTPARVAADTGVPVFMETPDAIAERFPSLESAARSGSWAALAAVPLVVHERVLGAIACAWSGPHAMLADERALLATIASQCAQALDRVRRDEAERDARAVAERERDRTLQLQSAAGALALPLTPARVVDVLLSQAHAQLGAYSGSVFELSEDGHELVLLHAVGLAPSMLARFTRLPVDNPTPSRDVVRSGDPVFLSTRAEWLAQYDPHALGESSQAWAALPLVADDRTLGILTLSFAAPRAFDDADRAFFLAFAQQGAQALARARLYEAERRARSEAAAANRAKMNFLAAMSHELRTPLNAIAGYTQLLEMELRGPITEQQRADLARIRSNQRHLLALVEDVLTYAKLEAGRTEFRCAETPLDDVVADVVGMMSPLADARTLTLQHTASNGACAWADREKLRQILINLVSNAMKFTPAGGRVSIDTEPRDDCVLLHVRDTGPGIADDQREHIFEAFVQLGRNATTPHDGVGLGLAISRDLAVGMGGDLSVVSAVGKGATFTVRLPLPLTP